MTGNPIDGTFANAGGCGVTAEVVVRATTVTCFVGDPACPEDLNLDELVNAADLSILLTAWGPCSLPSACVGDLDCDGQVNAADLDILLGAWGSLQPLSPRTTDSAFGAASGRVPSRAKPLRPRFAAEVASPRSGRATPRSCESPTAPWRSMGLQIRSRCGHAMRRSGPDRAHGRREPTGRHARDSILGAGGLRLPSLGGAIGIARSSRQRNRT